MLAGCSVIHLGLRLVADVYGHRLYWPCLSCLDCCFVDRVFMRNTLLQ